jgi:hypothetical protein
LLEVPQPDAAIGRGSHELVVVGGVELSVVDGVGVPLGQVEVLHVHVPLDRQQVARSVFIQEGELLVSVDDHEVRAGGVEAQVADGVAREWFDNTEAVHVFVHAVEVPQPNVVVQSASGHAVTFWLDCNAGDCLGVAVERSEGIDWHTHLVPAHFISHLIFLELSPIPDRVHLLSHFWFVLAALNKLKAFGPNHLL